MRGHRAKQYRKLMHQYSLTFNFREPYQVLLDAEIIQDAAHFKMDLIAGLKRTLQGEVKPMITQCSMRHLYSATPKDESLIAQAKTYERRRCNHHTLETPLNTIECLSSVVDPKDSRTNKHRYIIASQNAELRAKMRRIPGVPLIYINRSVMIMEPMASATEGVREQEEKGKFRAGIKGARGGQALGKRPRDTAGAAPGESAPGDVEEQPTVPERGEPVKKKRKQGAREPNPLSVKKPKKHPQPDTAAKPPDASRIRDQGHLKDKVNGANESEDAIKPKRRRKRKTKSDTENVEPVSAG
ncbi:hypothetical protein NA57DRAFT_55488 [Rhizodiscina lignyota]|uniref:U three protein 23 n=1 Tax=Rhizodiscina lignyota TaxID=1504668 RepID=A0A9P4IHS2_9PEZI|nr:hypothetical protein NA57DRAFT_55488 [Rhizodiscina lignyota]